MKSYNYTIEQPIHNPPADVNGQYGGKKNKLIVHADSGKIIKSTKPIYRFSMGEGMFGYYTIKTINGKKTHRQAFQKITYEGRLTNGQLNEKSTAINPKLDVSFTPKKIIHNYSQTPKDNPFVIAVGEFAQFIQSKDDIHVYKYSSTRDFYCLITPQSHLIPVATLGAFTRRGEINHQTSQRRKLKQDKYESNRNKKPKIQHNANQRVPALPAADDVGLEVMDNSLEDNNHISDDAHISFPETNQMSVQVDPLLNSSATTEPDLRFRFKIPKYLQQPPMPLSTNQNTFFQAKKIPDHEAPKKEQKTLAELKGEAKMPQRTSTKIISGTRKEIVKKINTMNKNTKTNTKDTVTEHHYMP